MKLDEVMSKLLGSSIPTYYNWKRENRKIIKLLEKYFSKEDLEEFLETDKISELDNLKNLDNMLITEYTNFINPIVYKSKHIILTVDKDYRAIYSYFPIFIFFEYIENNAHNISCNDYYSYDNYATNINDIIRSNEYDNLKILTMPTDMFKVNEVLMFIFYKFNTLNGFNYFYKNWNYDNLEIIEYHKYYNMLYLEFKKIKNEFSNDLLIKESFIHFYNDNQFEKYKKDIGFPTNTDNSLDLG
jgi:hypothetical protein